MSGKDRLHKAVGGFGRQKEDKRIFISGALGITINSQQTVDVANRDGFVWVRLRTANNEVIQALNDAVSPIYDLPVLVTRDEQRPNQYRIVGRDVAIYQDWGSTSSFMPSHGSQHSLVEGGGGDPVWVYGPQFMPLNMTPSGSAGGPGVIIYPYVYFFNDEWHYTGGTGTSSLLGSKPTNQNAKMVLVYLDATTGNYLSVAGAEFSGSITATFQIIPHLPSLGNPLTQIPVGAVRLVSGTARILWDNIYDLKPYYQVQASGTSGGAAGNGQVLVTGADTTLDYLQAKLVAGTNVTITRLNPGGSESLQIDASLTGATGTTFLTLTDTPSSYLGQGSKYVRVKSDLSGLEFANVPGAGGSAAFSGARRYLTSNFQLATGNGWQDLNFDDANGNGTSDFDTDNYFPTGTSDIGYYETNEAGYYHIHGQAEFSSPLPTGNSISLGLWYNNLDRLISQDQKGYFAAGTNVWTLSVTTTFYLSVGDNVRLRVFCGDSTQPTLVSGTSKTHFSLFKVDTLANFSGVRLYRTSNQNITTSTDTLVQWQTEEYDTDNYYTSASGTTAIWIGTTGYYHVSARCHWEQSNQGYRRSRLLKNGATYTSEDSGEPSALSQTGHEIEDTLYLVAGDYLQLEVWHNKGSDSNIEGEADGARTQFVLHFLGT